MRSLKYRIVTNLSCNLDCEYCYQRKDTRTNTIEDIEDFLTACFQRDCEGDLLDEVTVSFIGGEPLMYPDLIDRALTIASVLAKKYNVALKGAIITNATLFHKPRVQKLIERWGGLLSVSISMDGLPQTHDASRVFASSGKGTYAQTLNGVRFLSGKVRKIGFNVTISNKGLKEFSATLKHMIDVFIDHAGGIGDIAPTVVYDDIVTMDQSAQLANQMIEVIDHWVARGQHLNKNARLMSLIPSNNEYRDMFDVVKNSKWGNEIILTDDVPITHTCGSRAKPTCLGFDRKVYTCDFFATNQPKMAAIGYLDGKTLRTLPNMLLDEMANGGCKYPSECIRCPIKKLCYYCPAKQLENGNGSLAAQQEYVNQKHRCGWTWALSFAYQHWYNLFNNYDYRDLYVNGDV